MIKIFISGITSKYNFIFNTKKEALRYILVDQMPYFPTIPPGSIGFRASPSSSYKEKNINFIGQLKGNKNNRNDFGEI